MYASVTVLGIEVNADDLSFAFGGVEGDIMLSCMRLSKMLKLEQKLK